MVKVDFAGVHESEAFNLCEVARLRLKKLLVAIVTNHDDKRHIGVTREVCAPRLQHGAHEDKRGDARLHDVKEAPQAHASDCAAVDAADACRRRGREQVDEEGQAWDNISTAGSYR